MQLKLALARHAPAGKDAFKVTPPAPVPLVRTFDCRQPKAQKAPHCRSGTEFMNPISLGFDALKTLKTSQLKLNASFH